VRPEATATPKTTTTTTTTTTMTTVANPVAKVGWVFLLELAKLTAKTTRR
jgi:hypothetical protein